MGAKRARPVVLDTGALIAFERNDRRVRTLVELAIVNRGALRRQTGTSDVVSLDRAMRSVSGKVL